MSVAVGHWACDLVHPAQRGYRKDRLHRIGCAVAPGHNPEALPFKCRVCVRGYRPPASGRRLLDKSTHFACALDRKQHDPPVLKYSKTGHRDDCPKNAGHSGKQNSECVGCRMIYFGREGELPVGRLQDHPHWDCSVPPEDHKPRPMYGIGHRPGCGVADGHDPQVTINRCHACRRVRQQGSIKTARLAKIYRLTREEYDAMAAKQHGACAICGRVPTSADTTRTARGLHVDHDHGSGRIRGLLCYACNLALGYFRDDLETIGAAMDYLRGHTEA